MKKQVAIFEKVGVDEKLIAWEYKEKKDLLEDDVIVPNNCDLKTDGRYKYNRQKEAFEPWAHGFIKPKNPQVPKERAWYLFMKAVIDSEVIEKIPSECNQWMRWYEDNLKKREEEEKLIRRSK